MGAGDEDEALVAHADFVAGAEAGGAGDALAVDERAVLRGGVVQFAGLAGVDQDGTMATGDVAILDDHVVIRRAADSVDADLRADRCTRLSTSQ